MNNQTSLVPIDPVLTLAQVREAVPYSSAQLWRMIKAGTFPRPLRLGPNRVGWRQSAVAGYLDLCEARTADELAADQDALAVPSAQVVAHGEGEPHHD